MPPPATTYPNLNLLANPFVPIPPVLRYEKDFRPLFSARSAEVNQVCRRAANACALFVVAPFGGGKTMVLLEALSRLREGGTLTAYASFEREKGFRQAVLDGLLAAGCESIPRTHDGFGQARRTLQALHNEGRRVVLAIDDLDRATDIAEVFQVTHDVRDLLADGSAVIVTGQPFGVTFDLHTSAGGIFHEIAIPEFRASEFGEMLQKYLQSVHSGRGLSPHHPFDEAGKKFICEEMSKAEMTPRLFNFAVSELIDLAETMQLTKIPIEAVLQHWPTIARRVVRGLTSLQMRHLEIIFKQPVVSEDTPKAIADLGGHKLAEFAEVQTSVLRPMIEKNLVYVTKEKGKEQYRLTPHAAAALTEIVGGKLSKESQHKLLAEWRQCSLEQDVHSKGKALEVFVADFLRFVPGFSIPKDGLHLRTASQELDVVVEIVAYEHHVRYGVLTVCECKNWQAKIPGDELSHFRDKLKARGCIFGIFVAVNGVLPGFREKMKAYLQEGLVIALVTAQEFLRLENGTDPATILLDSYYSTLKYAGEPQHGGNP